jgi:ribosomal protein S18 acetylase RimI-like enzyme
VSLAQGASVVIRGGVAADIEACAALAQLAAAERDAAELGDSLLRDIENSEHLLVVAENAGEIIGYGRSGLFVPEPGATVDTAPRGYYLTGVFVRPEQRRMGVGSALTQARLEWISQHADDAWFFANARNMASITLHQRFGFEEITRRFWFPGLSFDGGQGILFRLRLRSDGHRPARSGETMV